jgi:hypothetical protein
VQLRPVHHDAAMLPPLALLSITDEYVLGRKGRPDVAPGVLGAADASVVEEVNAEPLERAVGVRRDVEAGTNLLAETGRLEKCDIVPCLSESQCRRLLLCQ